MRRALVVAATVLVVVVGLVWWFGFNHQTEKANERSTTHSKASASPEPQQEKLEKKLKPEEVDRLRERLVSRDPSTYGSVWAHDNVPSMAPAGTRVTLKVATFQSSQGFGRIDAVVTLPGEKVTSWRLLLQFKAGHWLVYTMEEVK